VGILGELTSSSEEELMKVSEEKEEDEANRGCFESLAEA
jgi:hypothetical protein